MEPRDLKLKIAIELDGEVMWTDYTLGTEDSFAGMFEEAGETLGKMEHNLKKVLERDYPREPQYNDE